MLNIKWAILLICACLWALSYATKISYQSGGDDLSPWTIYSYEGQLGWARVSLSGPDPEKKFATTAKPALKTYVAQHATHWISYNFHSELQSHNPDAEPNIISYASVTIGWLLMTIIFGISPLFRRKKTTAAPDTRDDMKD